MLSPFSFVACIPFNRVRDSFRCVHSNINHRSDASDSPRHEPQRQPRLFRAKPQRRGGALRLDNDRSETVVTMRRRRFLISFPRTEQNDASGLGGSRQPPPPATYSGKSSLVSHRCCETLRRIFPSPGDRLSYSTRASHWHPCIMRWVYKVSCSVHISRSSLSQSFLSSLVQSLPLARRSVKTNDRYGSLRCIFHSFLGHRRLCGYFFMVSDVRSPCQQLLTSPKQDPSPDQQSSPR